MAVRNRHFQHFSPYLSKVRFEAPLLSIKGRNWTAFTISFLFLLFCLYCLTLDMPLLIQVGCGLSVALLISACWDLWHARSSLVYDVAADHLIFDRYAKGKHLHFDGKGTSVLSVGVREESDTDFVRHFYVLLTFSNGQSTARFPLHNVGMSEQQALDAQIQWQHDLNLT